MFEKYHFSKEIFKIAAEKSIYLFFAIKLSDN